jgi:hypothetical protein
MKVEKQLSLFIENKPGTLANICRALADANINIYALAILDAVDHAVVRMIVSQPRKAMHLFGEHGILVIERDVLYLEGHSRPGELAGIAKKLARHKINIEYAYSATPPDADRGALIMRVDNLAKAKRVLRDH